MDKESARAMAAGAKWEDPQTIWEWAEDNIVFEKPYPALAPGPYDSSLTPFWREPMEAVTDRGVREVIVLKSSQGAGSENLLLMPMRHAVCCDPKTVMYIGGDEKSTEEFINERIKPGLKLSPELRRKYAEARELEHQIYYPDMYLVCGWSTAKGIFLQRPADLVLGDEVGGWAEYDAAKLRKRMATRAFPTLVLISALHASKRKATSQSPIWKEFQETDQRHFYMRDPQKKTKWFLFEMGWKDQKSGKESRHGLKWSEKAQRADGEWDMEKVRETAHYVTPWGTKIYDKDKLGLMQKGKWVAHKKTTNKMKRGYRITSFYMPWITFGEMAVNFLEAKAAGPEKLRIFVEEDLTEEWKEGVISLPDEEVTKRQGEYEKGTRMTKSDGVCTDTGEVFQDFYIKKPTVVLVTVDVQKAHGWWLGREWVKGGDSGLMDFGIWHEWGQLDKLASVKDGYGASHVLVDAGYPERTQETYEACHKYRFIPTMGKENIQDLLFTQKMINPFEGTRGQKRGRKQRIAILYFRTDPFKTQLMRRIRGETDFGWYIYHNIELEYIEQMTSEHKVNGVWDYAKSHRRNHLWDCEVLQLLGATRFGFNRFKGFEEAA